jgi:hypothetical protein
MGWLDRIKNFRDVQGVRLELNGPDVFRWADGNLPVTLTFNNSGDVDRIVTQIEVQIEEQSNKSHEASFRATVLDRFTVPGGQSVVRDYAVPLVLDDRPVDPTHLDQISTTLSGLVKRRGVGRVGFTGRCSIEVLISYEGSNRLGSATGETTAH